MTSYTASAHSQDCPGFCGGRTWPREVALLPRDLTHPSVFTALAAWQPERCVTEGPGAPPSGGVWQHSADLTHPSFEGVVLGSMGAEYGRGTDNQPLAIAVSLVVPMVCGVATNGQSSLWSLPGLPH